MVDENKWFFSSSLLKCFNFPHSFCFFQFQLMSPNSDVFHLAVNLLDRYHSYVPAKSEAEYRATAGACTMISLKIRRARRECLSYESLKVHFRVIREESIRVCDVCSGCCSHLGVGGRG